MWQRQFLRDNNYFSDKDTGLHFLKKIIIANSSMTRTMLTPSIWYAVFTEEPSYLNLELVSAQKRKSDAVLRVDPEPEALFTPSPEQKKIRWPVRLSTENLKE